MAERFKRLPQEITARAFIAGKAEAKHKQDLLHRLALRNFDKFWTNQPTITAGTDFGTQITNTYTPNTERADYLHIIDSHSRFIINLNDATVQAKSDPTKRINLTPLELRIYLRMLQNDGNYTKSQDFASIWKHANLSKIREYTKVNIFRIRRKFEKAGLSEEGVPAAYIETRGSNIGYRIVDPQRETVTHLK